jgi:DNA-binding NarL/FixJ family response regulator
MRSTASAHVVPAWTPAFATVLGGDPRARHQTARMLGDAGFGLRSEPEPGALIVLISPAREDARLRDIRELTEAHPSAAILAVVPTEVPSAGLRRVLLAGATGIVVEDDVERALVPTARAVLAGQLTVPSVLGQQVAPRPLSHREKQILALVMLGMTNREIASKLFLAESTVKTHLSSAFRKIDARSRSEAVARIQDPDAGYGAGILEIADGLAAA